MVAGPNGSGKTTITEKLLRHEWMEGCQYINPDMIAQQEFGDWNSPVAVIQAANKAKANREYYLTHNISMAFETVFSTQEKLEFLKRAKDAGFFIRFFFVCTNDPSIGSSRILMERKFHFTSPLDCHIQFPTVKEDSCSIAFEASKPSGTRL